MGVAGVTLLFQNPLGDDGDDPPADEDTPSPPPVTHWDGSPLGRIMLNVMTVYEGPDWQSPPTGKLLLWNEVVEILGAVGGNGLFFNNQTWLQTEYGYIYSSWVQPVNDQPNNPVVTPSEGGLWGMITVPYTWSRNQPIDDASLHQQMYYSSVHRIMGVENGYYLINEVINANYWLKASHLRIISPEEIAPISAHIPPEDKRIEVSIGAQMLYAFEGDQQVFQTQVSTGQPESPTPFGNFQVLDKRHGQRMAGGQGEGGYNLPGIPWICYFDRTWVATHGCYWHNDYGRRHSAGCINLHPEAAKWIFRWTTPTADYYAFRTLANPDAGQPGTHITVRW